MRRATSAASGRSRRWVMLRDGAHRRRRRSLCEGAGTSAGAPPTAACSFFQRAPRALPPVPDAVARAPRGGRASSSRTLSPRPSGPPQVHFLGDGRRESTLHAENRASSSCRSLAWASSRRSPRRACSIGTALTADIMGVVPDHRSGDRSADRPPTARRVLLSAGRLARRGQNECRRCHQLVARVR